jgi:hypothetical protein
MLNTHILTKMSHAVPTDQDKPNKSQPYNSDFCTPYDCSHHLFQWSHYILDIPENSVITFLIDINAQINPSAWSAEHGSP